MTTSWALLIDAENNQVANLEPLLRLVRHRGDMRTARVYGNFETLQPGWVDAAGRLVWFFGISRSLRHQERRRYRAWRWMR